MLRLLLIFSVILFVDALVLYDSHICYKRVMSYKGGNVKSSRIAHCCDGYIADAAAMVERLVCKPICMSGCANGTCTSPGVCECNPGYRPSSTEPHKCEPICSTKVPFSRCIAPETFLCNHGYAKVNQSCRPVCTEPCLYGTCVAPETCDCLPGFRVQGSGRCAPYCSRGCDHGKCVAPDQCECNEGWTMSDDREICVPVFYSNTTYRNETCEGLQCNCDEDDDCIEDNITESITTQGATDWYNVTGDYMVKNALPKDGIEDAETSTLTSISSWVWILIGVILLIVMSAMILIIFRCKRISLRKGRTYDVEEFEARERKPVKTNVRNL